MTVYAYVEARRYVNGQWELKRVCCRVCTSDTVFTLGEWLQHRKQQHGKVAGSSCQPITRFWCFRCGWV